MHHNNNNKTSIKYKLIKNHHKCTLLSYCIYYEVWNNKITGPLCQIGSRAIGPTRVRRCPFNGATVRAKWPIRSRRELHQRTTDVPVEWCYVNGIGLTHKNHNTVQNTMNVSGPFGSQRKEYREYSHVATTFQCWKPIILFIYDISFFF